MNTEDKYLTEKRASHGFNTPPTTDSRVKKDISNIFRDHEIDVLNKQKDLKDNLFWYLKKNIR